MTRSKASNGLENTVGVMPLPTVDERQQLAIAALVAGSTDTDAAAAAGVDRSTLHRWRTNDAAFAAALNLARRTLWDEHLDALRAAFGLSIRFLLEDLRSDGPNTQRAAAIAVLKLLGVPALQPDGPVTERQQAMAWDAERKIGVSDVLSAQW